MNFNQGPGSNQGFGFGFQQGQMDAQWHTQQQPPSQQQQHQFQWPSTIGHGQQQNIVTHPSDGRSAPNQNWALTQQQSHFPNMQIAERAAMPMQVSYSNQTSHASHPNQQGPRSLMVQDQGSLKQYQFEEQKRKLKEMSSRGTRPSQKGGKNMLDDFLSKTDFNLSSGAKQAAEQSRRTNVFHGQFPSTGNTQQQAHTSDLPHSQASMQSQPELPYGNIPPGVSYSQFGIPLPHSNSGSQLSEMKDPQMGVSNSSDSHHQLLTSKSFPSMGFPQSNSGFPQHSTSQYQAAVSHLQQPNQFQQAQLNSQSYNFPAEASQHGDDDFGDFQGGADSGAKDQGFNSLNSSTSSLSSLHPSSAGGPQRMGSIDSDQALRLSMDSTQFYQQKLSSFGNTSQHTAISDAMATPSQFHEISSAWAPSQTHVQHVTTAGGASHSWTSQPIRPSGHQTSVPVDSLVMSQAFPSMDSIPNTNSSAEMTMRADTGVVQGALDVATKQFPEEAADDVGLEESLYGSPLPVWCHDSASLPPVYKRVLDKSMALDGAVDTSKVYTILLSSNIPKDRLRDIWEMANKKNPGLLSEEELYLVLGLVALVQAGWTKLSIKKLSSCNPPPIPEFPEYVLMDSESGSVFGGDSLVPASNFEASSNLDPDDKYSVFRLRSSEGNAGVTTVNSTADGSIGDSLSWGDSFPQDQQSASATLQPVPMSTNASESKSTEDWADFQSPNSGIDLQNPLSASNNTMEVGLVNTPIPNIPDPSFTSSAVPKTFSKSGLDPTEFKVSSHLQASNTICSSHFSEAKEFEALSTPVFSHAVTSQSLTAGQNTVHSHLGDSPDDFGEFNSVSSGFKGIASQPTAHHSDMFSAFADVDKKPEGKSVFSTTEDADKADVSWDEFASFKSDTSSLKEVVQVFSPGKNVIKESLFGGESLRDDASSKKDVQEQNFGVDNDFAEFSKASFATTTSDANNLNRVFEEGEMILPVHASRNANDFAVASLRNFDKVQSNEGITQSTNARESPKPPLEIEDSFADFSSHKPQNENHISDAFSHIKELDFSQEGNTDSPVFQLPNDTAFANFTPGRDNDGGTTASAPSSSGANEAEPFGANEAEPFGAFADFGKQQSTMATGTLFVANSAGSGDSKSQMIASSGVSIPDASTADVYQSSEDTMSQLSDQPVQEKQSKFIAAEKPLSIEDQLKSFATSISLNAEYSSIGKVPEQVYKPSFYQTTDSKNNDKVQDEGVFSDSALCAKDRYKALAGDLEDSELHIHEWKRCFNSIKKVFEFTTEVIKRHNLSLSTKKEVFESKRGQDFFSGLKEVFAIACRLKISIDKSAIARSNEGLKIIVNDVDKLWRVISGFSSGLPEFSFPDSLNVADSGLSEASVESHCSICLHNLDVSPVVLNNWVVSATSLTYGGKQYHSTCANFWCNKVNPVLPALPPLVSGLL